MRKVLVLEDEASIRSFIVINLRRAGYEVVEAESGEEALQKLLPRTHNGAIILLHSTSKTNAKVLDELIQNWKTEGYKFKSVTELNPLS